MLHISLKLRTGTVRPCGAKKLDRVGSNFGVYSPKSPNLDRYMRKYLPNFAKDRSRGSPLWSEKPQNRSLYNHHNTDFSADKKN